MKKASGSTTVTISTATLEKLGNVKKEYGFKNMNVVLEYLLSLPRDPVPKVAEDEERDGEWEAPEKRRKKRRSPAAVLDERAGRKARHVGVLHGV